MKPRIVAVVCWSLLAAAVMPLFAQAQSPSRASESIQVNLIEVPVNVYDRDGNPMRDLTAAQFEITDDGKKQDITNFDAVDLAVYARNKQTPPTAARRNFMLLFDLSNSTPGTIGRSRQAALDFVKNELLPTDVVAVATYSVENGFNLLTSFTPDRDALAAAVTTLGNPKYFKKLDPLLLSALMTGDVDLEKAMRQGAPTTVIEGSQPGEPAPNQMEGTGQLEVGRQRQDEEYRRQRVTRQISALANIGRALDSISGRKQIVLLSEGFDAQLVQGRDAGSSKQSREETDKILSGESYEVDNDARFGSTTASSAVSKMGELLRRSDVVLHAIDIKGLRGASDAGTAGAARRTNNEGLYLVTRPTGGEVFKNANDLSSSFRALLKQQEVVYILGFNSSSKGASGKFHNIKVKVKVPGAKVSYRSGYYEPRVNVSPIEAALTAGEILLNDVTFDDVKTSIMASPFPVKGGSPQVPVVMEIDGRSLMAGAKNNGVNTEIYVYAFDQENKIKDFLYQRVGLDLTKVGEPLQKSGLKFYGTLSLPPGKYAIKTLVRLADAGRDGFKRIDVLVPDFTKPTVMQPVAIEPAGGWLMVRAAAKPGTKFDYPFAIAADSFVPGTSSAASPHQFAVFAYNVDPKDLVVTGKIRMPDGTTRDANVSIARTTAADPLRGSQLVVEVKTDGLAAGQYAVDLSLQPKGGGWTQSFTVPLSIR